MSSRRHDIYGLFMNKNVYFHNKINVVKYQTVEVKKI